MRRNKGDGTEKTQTAFGFSERLRDFRRSLTGRRAEIFDDGSTRLFVETLEIFRRKARETTPDFKSRTRKNSLRNLGLRVVDERDIIPNFRFDEPRKEKFRRFETSRTVGEGRSNLRGDFMLTLDDAGANFVKRGGSFGAFFRRDLFKDFF